MTQRDVFGMNQRYRFSKATSYEFKGTTKQKRRSAAFQVTRVPPESLMALKPAFSPLSKKHEKRTKPKQQLFHDAAESSRYQIGKIHHQKVVLAPRTGSATSPVSRSMLDKLPTWTAKYNNQGISKPCVVNQTECLVSDELHEEILAYSTYTKETVNKMSVHIEQMIANVRSSVQSLWPQAKVETFGSYSTGIWLPSSDVDLVILNVVEVNDSKLTAKHLRQLLNELKKKQWVDSLLCLDTAKMPVLKLVCAESSVPIDITFESTATHSGLLARDLIKRYADTTPELYPLAIVLKQLLRDSDLNDAYTGGLSSYAVVLMVIHYLQLWRNGYECFEAASVYASGSLPKGPTKTHVIKTGRLRIDASDASKLCNKSNPVGSKAQRSSPIDVGPVKKVVSPPSQTSTYAAVVANRQAVDGSRCSALSEPRLSYAAVAAGTAKIVKKVKPPSSYAAAVTAPTRAVVSATKCTNGIIQTMNTQLDSVSVSSSNADTEDSSSSCSHSTLADSDEEGKPQSQPYASLGEHLKRILEFFGIIFDYRKNGLSVRDGGYIYRLAAFPPSYVGKPALVIEDPIHPDRNVSASSYAFSKVVALFEDSYYALKYFRASKFTPSALSCLLRMSSHVSQITPTKAPIFRSDS
ncbi:hypothetical protein CCR75_004315 [Bremia lactucae]|uniref:Polymerase nucleotidyl transferase domain-containing protein n=1 Tax=Bremia lactucae TaxID=4779 RepID=A0A976FL76_BRELC|nr:hypothetical protein CCR75_004315 [Bremia lactucae]